MMKTTNTYLIEGHTLLDIYETLVASKKLAEMAHSEDFKHQQMSVEQIKIATGWAGPVEDFSYLIKELESVLFEQEDPES